MLLIDSFKISVYVAFIAIIALIASRYLRIRCKISIISILILINFIRTFESTKRDVNIYQSFIKFSISIF